MRGCWSTTAATTSLILVVLMGSRGALSQETQRPPEGIDQEALMQPRPCDGIHAGPCVEPACRDMQFVDHLGEPLRQQIVRVRKIETRPGRKASIVQIGLSKALKRMRTDQDGRVSLKSLPSGKFVLEMPTGDNVAYATVVLTNGQGIERCERRLQLDPKASTFAATSATGTSSTNVYYYQKEFEAFETGCGANPAGLEAGNGTRRFAKHELLDPWKEYTGAEAEKVAGWLEHATVSSAVGKVRLVRLVLSSESGDWYHNIDYCFRQDGSLWSLLAVLNSFYGNYSLIRELEFDSNSIETRQSATYYMLGTSTTMNAPPEAEDMKEIVQNLPVFRTTGNLPFADFLVVKKAHAPSH